MPSDGRLYVLVPPAWDAWDERAKVVPKRTKTWHRPNWQHSFWKAVSGIVWYFCGVPTCSNVFAFGNWMPIVMSLSEISGCFLGFGYASMFPVIFPGIWYLCTGLQNPGSLTPRHVNKQLGHCQRVTNGRSHRWHSPRNCSLPVGSAECWDGWHLKPKGQVGHEVDTNHVKLQENAVWLANEFRVSWAFRSRDWLLVMWWSSINICSAKEPIASTC